MNNKRAIAVRKRQHQAPDIRTDDKNKPTAGHVVVRDAVRTDAAPVITWFASREEAILWAGNSLPAQVDAPWFEGEIADAEQRHRVFVGSDDQIIAIYGLRFVAAEKRAHLRRVAVNPVSRGLGIGRLLVSDALSTARDLQAQTISLHVYGSNTVAIRLYEAAGFKTRLTSPAPEDPSAISLYMTLQVSDCALP
jgi:ribosomal protein S18 acetylase RimI-like enzyme